MLVTPRLRIEAVRGAADAVISLGNFQVTAPREAIREQELLATVKALLAEPLPRADVVRIFQEFFAQTSWSGEEA